MSSDMKFSKQFKSMFPSRTTSAPLKTAHIRTLPNGNELFVVFSSGTDGGIVTAWEEDHRGSGGDGWTDIPISPSSPLPSSGGKDYPYTGGPIKIPAAPGEALFMFDYDGFSWELPLPRQKALDALQQCKARLLSVPDGSVTRIKFSTGEIVDAHAIGAPYTISELYLTNILAYLNFKLLLPARQPGPRARAFNNPANSGSVPASIGWGQPILMPAANVREVAETYLIGVQENKGLIWLSPFVFNMFPFAGFKIVAVTKRKGRGIMIKEKGKKWFVPMLDGFELKDLGDKDIMMLMFKLEALFGND